MRHVVEEYDNDEKPAEVAEADSVLVPGPGKRNQVDLEDQRPSANAQMAAQIAIWSRESALLHVKKEKKAKKDARKKEKKRHAKRRTSRKRRGLERRQIERPTSW